MSSNQYLEVSASAGNEPTGNEPVVTLKQAGFSLLLLLPYVLGSLVILGVVGAFGFIELTTEAILPLGLGVFTVAVMLSLYFHLMRRNSLTFADLGFRRPGRSMIHLLWQIPGAIAVGYAVQGLFIGLLNLLGINATSDNAMVEGIVDLPVSMIVISALAIAVAAPVWEEVLFRGAFLDGFTSRFGAITGILLSSVLFAAVHMIPLNLVFLFTLGIALALLRRFHKNIWAPILLHAVNNGFSVAMLLMAT